MATNAGRARWTLGLIIALAAGALAVSACGGGATDDEVARADVGTSETTDTTGAAVEPVSSDPEEAGLQFARCMRQQGLDWPDPQTTGSGRGRVTRMGPANGLDPRSPKVQDAMKQCRRYLDAVRPDISEEDQQAFRDAALEFAKCMREHGVDMPDPTVNADGGINVIIERGRVDPESPTFQKADEACRSIMEEALPEGARGSQGGPRTQRRAP